jgi:hypothetical protein
MRRDALTWYLEAALAGSVEVRALRPLGTDGPTTDPNKSGARGASDPKAFGYGRPIQIDLLLDGVPRSYVLSTMRVGSGFGHDHFADRAGALIWAHDAYGRLPRHVRSLDVGFITREGELRSAGGAEEFFLLMEKVEGAPYCADLERVRRKGTTTSLDLDRTGALSAYLAKIHVRKGHDVQLYFRRTRDLLGHGEGIMGILDGYPADYPLLPAKQQYLVEAGCLAWRHHLKEKVKRLASSMATFTPGTSSSGMGPTSHCSIGAGENGGSRPMMSRPSASTISSSRCCGAAKWRGRSRSCTIDSTVTTLIGPKIRS